MYPSTPDQIPLWLEEVVPLLPPKEKWHRLEPVPPTYKNRKFKALIEGCVAIDTCTVKLHIGFTATFPLSVPQVFLTEGKALGRIPHLEKDGFVCYVKGDSQFLNYQDPFALLKTALEWSIKTLESGYQNTSKADFIDGFAEYWSRLDDAIPLRSVVKAENTAKKIAFALVPPDEKKAFNYVADDEANLRRFIPQVRKQTYTIQSALYIPLKENTMLIPPWHNEGWTMAQIQQILEQFTSPETKEFVKKNATKFKTTERVVFALPRMKGGFALFGMQFIGVEKAHPLTEGATIKRMIPIHLIRLDREYLTPRGGGLSALYTKHVALIGCGAVGSQIGSQLASAGVGKITAIDSDILTYENAYRHAVGHYAVGTYKAVSLKTDIELRVPYIEVIAIKARIEELMTTDKFDLASYDAIVMATGEPTINLYVNEWLAMRSSKVPIVYAWLDPYGIGGHCLLRSNHQMPGCLQCLYQITEEGHMENRASFAKPGQSFLKDMAGCGSLFTPFGSLDAVCTAESATRLLIGAILGESANQLRSWKGNNSAFSAAGYHLTNRYYSDEISLQKQQTQFHRDDCTICGKGDG